ncbi:DUF4339 domain-containing protein [Acetobacteraceae bacterium]|nr:DUF4339 domain-containing protein [Acetobacteraceae bacterium]
MAQWFYEKDGKPTGPVSQLEIARLIISGSVKEDTLVWTSNFGEKWRRADEAGLPRVVARKMTLSEKGKEAEASTMIATSFLEAMEKRQANLSSFWAVLFFALPIFANIISAMLFNNTEITSGLSASYFREIILLFIIFLTLKILVLKKDRQAMAEAGYRPLSYWWLLLPPGYFLLRWERTKKYLGLFLVTMAIYCAALFEAFLPSLQAQVNEIQKNMPVASASSTPQNQNNQAISVQKVQEIKK